MKRKKTEPLKSMDIDIQLKGIELLASNLQIPTSGGAIHHGSFNFNINIETKLDALNKRLFAIVHVEILTEDLSQVLGGISVSCIFELKNFGEFIKFESTGKHTLPQELVEIINNIALSTTRGIMFATFKGTPLHNAFLPIIDPKTFRPVK